MQLKLTGNVSTEHTPRLQIPGDFCVRLCRAWREMCRAAGTAEFKLHLAQLLSLQVLTGTAQNLLRGSKPTLNQGCPSQAALLHHASCLLETGKAAFHFFLLALQSTNSPWPPNWCLARTQLQGVT